MKKKVVIALGGNAILNQGEKGTYEEQMKNVETAMTQVAQMIISEEYEVIITHGNGPQVGNILIQNASAVSKVPAMPMFICGAMSQGQIGYLIQQSLINLGLQSGKNINVVTVVTQVEVGQKDYAFQNPSKPVGPFYLREESERLAQESGFTFKEDAGRGYRRVVPSPKPINILEIEEIKSLVNGEVVVVASGGGGIPVVKEGNKFKGVDAVIDKDWAGALLSDLLDAELFIILTAVEKVALNFGKENQQLLDKMTLEEAKKYLGEGHFAEGSMKPKIEAAVEFVSKLKNRKALITHNNTLKEGLEGKNGTWIINE